MSQTVLSTRTLVQLIAWLVLCMLLIWSYGSCSWSTQSVTIEGCEQSLAESDGFICEPNSVWNLRKSLYDSQDSVNVVTRAVPYYFEANWEPNFHCTYAQRIGTMGDGGKWVCDPHRLQSRQDCLVYSAGSNGDFSFEREMKKAFPHCEIHTFDKNSFTCPTNTCTFHQIMIGDGIEPNGSKSWSIIRQELNHTHRSMEILKLDIEGGEFAVFPLLFNTSKSAWPRQILVEFHPRNVTTIHAMFYLLRRNNYVIFSKENNVAGGPYFFEYGFLRFNAAFFTRSS